MQWNRGAWIGTAFALFSACLMGALILGIGRDAEAGQKLSEGEYRILEPLQSGELTLFPVVRVGETGKAFKWEYITLDEGLRSGEVSVVEAGQVRGLVRPRDGHPLPSERRRIADQVNTLVLVNNSDKPLLLLAGEIVTGGKQDRIIGKDRIVPAKSDPIDLSVFCIEPGRWVESSSKFGAATENKGTSFMVQPSVRAQAMVREDQQQVWNSVHRSMDSVQVASAAPAVNGGIAPMPSSAASLGTTSYAKAMKDERVSKQVDAVSEPLLRSSQQVLQKLRDEHAVGVVVAVHGQIVWADIFATPDLLAAYWTKLVRSYAAEALANRGGHGKQVTISQAQLFLDRPAKGSESAEGETGVYRYREVRGEDESSFFLQVLLPGTDFYAHISRVAQEGTTANFKPAMIR